MTDPLVTPAGLKGVVVADTAIGSVRGAEGFYHYRQYDATELARSQSFESVAHLLLDGSLPDTDGEAAFRAELATARHLGPNVASLLEPIAAGTNGPLAALRAALPLLVGDTPTLDLSPEERRAAATTVIGAAPAIMAGAHRVQQGEVALAADPSLGHAADYVRLVTGHPSSPELTRAVETYLMLTADHGFNNSTFTTRVITSTGADVGGIIGGAIAALSGPLHGGAPSRVLDMIDAIGKPSNAEHWVGRELEAGNKIMGFGHAVYRADDPRSDLLKETAIALGGDLVATALEIEERILAVMRDWKPDAVIVTNVEYYAALVLHLAGIPPEMFTATFTVSRLVGWCAHLLEQAADNKIIRPSARYTGPTPTPM